MPNDYFTLNALCKELDSTLKDAKIDKIHMPENDEIHLYLRCAKRNCILAISANAQNPRIHLTNSKKQNPLTAPSFCMHLRKHLSSGTVESVVMLGGDRIICLNIFSRNELHDKVNYMLVAEMMGRYSNILLVDEKGRITDTLKQASYDTATKRCLLPSVKYELPPQNKIPCSDGEKIKELLRSYTGQDLGSFIMANISGFAPSTVRELIAISNLRNDEKPDENGIEKLCENIKMLLDVNASQNYRPCVSVSNDVPDDYFVFPYSTNGQKYVAMPSLNAAIEECTGKKDAVQRQQEHSKYLAKAFRSAVSKTEKRLEKCNARLAEASDLERNRKYGELITANLYKIQKGDKSVTVQDYYREDMPEVTIPLDVMLSPQQNAQLYFKRYAKQKRTLEVVREQIEECESSLLYLKSIAPSIAMCRTDSEIAEVEAELVQAGALRPQSKRNKQKTKPAQPVFYEIDGFTVAVGKNNIQNDKLTFKLANGNDIWIHAKDAHGSHTIIFAEAREIPDKVIQTACEIACFYSQSQQGTKIACDYTQRKNLRRHPSGKPGMVLYTTYNTAYVTPCSHEEYLSKD